MLTPNAVKIPGIKGGADRPALALVAHPHACSAQPTQQVVTNSAPDGQLQTNIEAARTTLTQLMRLFDAIEQRHNELMASQSRPVQQEGHHSFLTESPLPTLDELLLKPGLQNRFRLLPGFRGLDGHANAVDPIEWYRIPTHIELDASNGGLTCKDQTAQQAFQQQLRDFFNTIRLMIMEGRF
jgi:hypothetical protein